MEREGKVTRSTDIKVRNRLKACSVIDYVRDIQGYSRNYCIDFQSLKKLCCCVSRTLVLSNESIKVELHRERFRKLLFRALALRLRSDVLV